MFDQVDTRLPLVKIFDDFFAHNLAENARARGVPEDQILRQIALARGNLALGLVEPSSSEQ